VRLPAPFYPAGDHLAIDLPKARVVFTTRRGGGSTGPYASLNLGRLTDDEPDSVKRNRAQLETELGVTFAQIRQVHGARVALIDTTPGAGPPVEADGHATALDGVAPIVLTADCLPIAVAGDGVVAMLHAGWRGLAAGVVGEGARAVRELGARGPLSAAIGPGAGVCCYEVGDEVHEAFAGQDGPAPRHGRKLDLKAIARRELERAGVETIHDVELCTICADPSLFYSHRRDRGITGRQAGIAWLRRESHG
jgi:purine-nucleoside/S-methyl-5'-thioadenosine phosphorylase / adenosine deaminase